MEPRTSVEKISGSPLTTIAATIVATVGTATSPLLAPLLPVLTTIPAAIRHAKRVEQAIRDIELDLLAQKDQLQNLTDGQYEFVTATIAAVFSTVQRDKIELLRTAISNGITEPLDHCEAQFMSRVIRDVSPGEAQFLLDSIRFRVIHIGPDPKNSEALNITRNSPKTVLVSGLVSLGLLGPGDTIYLEVSSYQFSPITAKAVALLSKPNQSSHA